MANAEGAERRNIVDVEVLEVDTVLPDGTEIEEIDIHEILVEHPGHGPGHGGGHAPKTIVVTVNTKFQVTLPAPEVTGIEIKQAAIDQGVPAVELSFKLSVVHDNDSTEVVGDHQRIHVHPGEQFVIVAGDVNS